MLPKSFVFSIIFGKVIFRWFKFIYMFCFGVFFSSCFCEMFVKINRKTAQKPQERSGGSGNSTALHIWDVLNRFSKVFWKISFPYQKSVISEISNLSAAESLIMAGAIGFCSGFFNSFYLATAVPLLPPQPMFIFKYYYYFIYLYYILFQFLFL